MCMYRDTSEKWGLSHTNPEKKGPIIYLAVLRKGVIRHAHSYIGSYTHPLPPADWGQSSSQAAAFQVFRVSHTSRLEVYLCIQIIFFLFMNTYVVGTH